MPNNNIAMMNIFMLNFECHYFLAVLRLSGREPRRVPPVGDDVRQLSQAPRLLHHRHHARQAPRGEFLRHTPWVEFV